MEVLLAETMCVAWLVEDLPVTWWELSFRVMDVRVNTGTERPNRGEFALLCDRAWALSFKQWNAS